MIFEFNNQLQAQNAIAIDNLGTFALKGTNDQGLEYYIVAKNIFGMVHLLEWGPIMPDMFILIDGYSCKYTKTEYKEGRLEKIVDFWLNDKTKKLTQAVLIEPDDALCEVLDIQKQMWNIEENSDGD